MAEMATRKRPKNLFYYINTLVVFLLIFGIGALPPFGQITQLGMQILGIFVGTLYGWCTVGLVWPSIIAIIGVGLTSYCTVTESFSTGFGNEIPITIVVVYTLAAFMEESGLSGWLANWFISRKAGEGRPWMFTFLIFLAAYVLSALISLYATIIILWAIFYKICDQIGEKHGSKYTGMVIAGIVIICSLTGMIFPFKPFSVIVLGLAQNGIGTTLEYNFVTWTVYNFLISFAMMVLYMVVCRFVIRPDMTKVKEAGAQYAYLRDAKMNRDEKIAFVVLIAFIVLLMLPSIVPESVPGMTQLSNLGVIGIGMLCITVMAIVKTKEGKAYVSIPELIKKGVNWELVILIAATMPLSNALEAEESGVLQTVIAWMTQVFSGLSATAFLVIITVLFILVTQVTHNLVLVMVFTPVLAQMGLNFGANPLLVSFMIYYSAFTAFCTPAASSNAALIFGNAEWINTKQAYLTGILILLIALAVLICIGIPLGNVLL